MKDIVLIRNETACEEAIAEVRRLWGAEPDTADGNRLDMRMVLVDDYENRNHTIDPPDPIEAILIRMEAMGLERADLGKMLGFSSGRLPEILNRRRRLTIEMMRVLASALKLSANCLLKPYEVVPRSNGASARPSGQTSRKGGMAA
jgi:HTH-type transcriptional regulator / antitoxin HigA